MIGLNHVKVTALNHKINICTKTYNLEMLQLPAKFQGDAIIVEKIGKRKYHGLVA